MDNRLKVLEVSTSLNKGGTEAFIINNVLRMDKQQFKPSVLVLWSSDSPYKKLLNNESIDLIFAHVNASFKKSVHTLLTLIRLFKKGDYDIVHSHANQQNGIVLLAALLSGVKVRISHCHRIINRTDCGTLASVYYNHLLPWLSCACASYRLACTKEVGISIYGNHYFSVINNSIDCEKFKIGRIKVSRLGIPEGTVVFGNISRFDTGKNIEFVIDVFFEILQLNPRCFLIIGGPDAGTKNKVIERIKEYKIEQHVIVLATVDKIIDIYSELDCCIFPSLSEGLSYSLLEMQSAGIPCIVSDTVVKETDQNLGMMLFKSLQDTPKLWAESALSIIQNRIQNINDPFYSFAKKRYIENNLELSISVQDLSMTYLRLFKGCQYRLDLKPTD